MDIFKSLLAVLLSAAFTENAMLVRGLCLGEIDHRAATFRSVALDSLWTLPLCLLAAISGWLGSWLALQYFPFQMYLRPPLYLAIYIIIFFLIQIPFRYIHKLMPYGMRYLSTHSAIAFGFVPIATMLTVGQGAFSFQQAIFFALGTALGYFLSVELLVAVRDQLLLSKLPASMKGLPVLLVSFGLISLALFVLLGHELAL